MNPYFTCIARFPVCILHFSFYILNLNAQLFQLPPIVDDVEDHLGPDERGIEVDDNAETERYGESLNRPCAEQEQRPRGYERRHVRGQDSKERAVISRAPGWA